MSSSSSASWLTLLDDKTSEVEEKGCDLCHQVNDERTFRNALEAISKQYKDNKDIHREQSRLIPSFYTVRAFTKAVAHPIDNLTGNDLEALIWSVSIVAIERGLKAGLKLATLASILKKINDSVPEFGEGVMRYPGVAALQTPLQDIFCGYVDLCLLMITTFDSEVLQTRIGLLQSHVESTAKKFAKAKRKHEKNIFVAEQVKAEMQYDSHKRTYGIGSLDINDASNVQPVFIAQEKLGSGSFGRVDRVQETSTGESYARKYIQCIEGPSKVCDEAEVKKEIEIMQKLRHHHIAAFLFHVKDSSGINILMLPVAERNLKEFLELCIQQTYPLNLVTQIFPWFGCLISALEYAHKHKIKHSDIKLANILVKDGQTGEPAQVFLTDFGLARDFSDCDASYSHGPQTRGTRRYWAPEVEPKGQRNYSTDIFALGCVYTEMLTVSKRRSMEDFLQAVSSGNDTFEFRDDLPRIELWLHSLEKHRQSDEGSLVVDTALKMLNQAASKRPSARAVLNKFRQASALFCEENCR